MINTYLQVTGKHTFSWWLGGYCYGSRWCFEV